MDNDLKRLEILNKELEIELEIVKDNLKEKTKMHEEKTIELEETKKELNKILYSRSYKFICKIKKLMVKIN